MIRIFFVSLSCLCAMMRAALAHEFWLSAQEYQLPKGGQIVAELRVGQNFKGSGHAYLPRNTADFFLLMPTGKTEITPRLGDRPAVSLAAPEKGLAVIVHETTDRRVYYQKPDKFLSFVKNKGLGSVLAREKALTTPDTTFSESYRRYAKSLIAIGPGQGADQVTGLETEFVPSAIPIRMTSPMACRCSCCIRGSRAAMSRSKCSRKRHPTGCGCSTCKLIPWVRYRCRCGRGIAIW